MGIQGQPCAWHAYCELRLAFIGQYQGLQTRVNNQMPLSPCLSSLHQGKSVASREYLS